MPGLCDFCTLGWGGGGRRAGPFSGLRGPTVGASWLLRLLLPTRRAPTPVRELSLGRGRRLVCNNSAAEGCAPPGHLGAPWANLPLQGLWREAGRREKRVCVSESELYYSAIRSFEYRLCDASLLRCSVDRNAWQGTRLLPRAPHHGAARAGCEQVPRGQCQEPRGAVSDRECAAGRLAPS